MRIDAALARDWRAFLRTLFRFSDGPPSPDNRVSVLQFGFGLPLDPGQPSPTEFRIMALGNVGQRVPLVVKALKADGTPGETAGPARFEVADNTVTEVREEADGRSFAYLLAQGSSTITAFVPLPSGTELEAVGLVVVNDPADDATIVELEIGAAEDVPASA